MVKYIEARGTWDCECCGDYEKENKRSVNMHEIKCKKNTELETLREQVKKQESEPVAKQEPETEEEESKEEIKPERTERIPFGARKQKLIGPDDDKFQYRYFNDNWSKEPGRIQRAERAGYVRVEDYESVNVGTNDDGSPIKGILMKIPKEIYEEDQKVKRKEIDRVDEAIQGGKIEQQPGENRYVPDGIKVWSSHNEDR